MVYRPMVDLLSQSAPGVYTYGLSVAGGNDVAAMPSLHAAMATGIWFAARGTRLVWVGAVYAIAMWIALVYLGEHYVVDVLAGAALMAWSWRTVSRSSRGANS
jgi:membrane-associated phospholipid phosphatase